MAGPNIGHDFRAVDSAGDPAAFIAYLDDARRLLGDLKRETIGALQLRRGDSVLDVGCGTGDDLRSLADIVGPEGRVVGIDVSEHLVAEARRRTRDQPAIEVVTADAHAMPFGVGEFSATRADRVLMHVEDPAAVLAQMAGSTRPGGRMVVVEPDWDTLIVDSDDMAIARRVVRAQADTIRHPDIGRRLMRLASGAHLTVDAVRFTTIPVRDAAMADAAFRLRFAVERLDDHTVWRWWETLQRQAQEGLFFSAMTGVTLVARAPAS
jgi:SAM-dependent methyltransferase